MVTVIFNGSKSWAHNLNDLRERWKIRRESPIKFVVPMELFKQDILKLTKSELLQLHVELQAMNNKAKKVLIKAHMSKRYENTKMEQDDYCDLYHTVNSIGAHIQAIQNELSKIKDKHRDSVDRHFINICREKLPKETWHEIMQEANERVKTTQ